MPKVLRDEVSVHIIQSRDQYVSTTTLGTDFADLLTPQYPQHLH